MRPREITHGSDAQAALARGVEQLARIVRPTLGPGGRTVVISRGPLLPLVTKDGATVAKEIVLPDPAENAGAQLARQAALRTGEVAGDGTTTATVLMHAIHRSASASITTGLNPVEVQRGVKAAIEAAAAEILQSARKLSTTQDLARVASISANDGPMGQLVAEAFEAVAPAGIVLVEEGHGTADELHVLEGTRLDRGWMSPYFADDASGESRLENVLILLHDGKISSPRAILPLVQQAAATPAASLLIIAEDVEAETLAGLVVNKVRRVVPICAVRAPGYGPRRREALEDLATMTGGQVVGSTAGMPLENVRIEHLGRARRATVTRMDTVLVAGHGNAKDVESRTHALRGELDSAIESGDATGADRIRGRIARLNARVASIRVGAYTSAEAKERRERYDDAIRAIEAALAEGVVPGGGLALVRCAPTLRRLREEAQAAGRSGHAAGIRAVEEALWQPAFWIAQNAGHDGDAVVAALQGSPQGVGFDALRGEFIDLEAAGILDPAKVVRIALQNAGSATGTLLAVEGIVVDANPAYGEHP